MGYVLTQEGFSDAISQLRKTYRIFAPVRKKGAGRFTDVDAILYDEVNGSEEIELHEKSDYSAKEVLTPLSETLFYFTEGVCKEADLDTRPVLLFLRSCDLHAMKRQDQIYLANGMEKDFFYQRRRELVHYVLIGCSHSFENCFCVDMKSNVSEDGYAFSVDEAEGMYRINVLDERLDAVFSAAATSKEEVVPAHVTQNEVHVRIPETIPAEIMKHPLWDEYEPVGGHGGMDYLVLSAFMESVVNGFTPPIDVYDAAAYMCITALSEESILKGGAVVAIPDFTRGKWYMRSDVTQGKFKLSK